MGTTGPGVGGEWGTEGAAPSNQVVGNGFGGVVFATASEIACPWEANRRKASVSLVSGEGLSSSSSGKTGNCCHCFPNWHTAQVGGCRILQAAAWWHCCASDIGNTPVGITAWTL